MLDSRKSAAGTSLTGFDGIRAIACLWVIAFHLFQKLDSQFLTAAAQELLSMIFLGNIGVSIFFVLSGALLSYPFWKSWLVGSDSPSLSCYAMKRLSRIAPGFYLSMLVSLVLSVTVFGNALNTQLLLRFVSGIVFLSSFHWITFFPVEVNGPLWSIGYEVFSYVLLAILMLVMFRVCRNRNITTGFVYWLGIAILCAVIHLLIVTYLIPSDEGKGWEYGEIGGAKSWMPWYNPIGMFNHFLLGIFAAGFLSHLQRVSIRNAWHFDAIVIATWISIGAYLASYRHAYTGFNGELGNIYFWPWFPMAVAVSLCFLPFTRVIGRMLDNCLLRYLAKISFGLYIWHALVIETLHVTVFPDFYIMGTKTLSAWYMPAFMSFSISVAVAALSYKYVEQPALLWGRSQVLAVPKSSRARWSSDSLGKAQCIATAVETGQG